MAARKKVTRKVPPPELPPSATEEGRLSIQFEELRGDFRLAFEGIAALREDMERGFQKAEEKAELRFSTLEASAREHSREIRELKTDVAELKADVAELKADVAELKTDVAELKTSMVRVETKLDGKADSLRVDRLEGRVDRLEKRPA